MPNMHLRAWQLGFVAALAGCGTTVEPAPPPTVNVKTLGRAGGTVVGQGSAEGVDLVVPFGALTEDTPVALGEDPAPPANPPGLQPASISVLLSPEGLALARPATLIIPFHGFSNVTPYAAPAVAGIPWQPYDGGVADASTRTLRVSISHFSRWRAFVPALPDAGSPADGG